MRKIAIALTAFAAIGIALPVTSPASADTVKKVIIKHGDRDHDRAWHRAHDRHHDKKVVVIKGRGDRDHDHDHHD
jgi:Ni/Co efflux regulator RcnB